MNKKDIKTFEANFLDGDSINSGAMFSVSGVTDVIDFFKDKQKNEIKDIVKGKLKAWLQEKEETDKDLNNEAKKSNAPTVRTGTLIDKLTLISLTINVLTDILQDLNK